MATASTQHLVSLVSHVAVRVGKALVRGKLLAVPIQRQTRTVHYGPQSLHGRNFTSWVRLTHMAHGEVRTLQQTATNLNTANNAPARWCQNLATDSNKPQYCQQCHQQGDVRTWQQTATNLNTANNATSKVMSEPGNRRQQTSMLPTMPPARWCQNPATASNKPQRCQQCNQQGDVRTANNASSKLMSEPGNRWQQT